MISEKRFEYDKCTGIKDLSIDENDDQFLYPTQIVDLLNFQNTQIKLLEEENERLRLELETHKHPLWSTREAERKVNKLADSLADEVRKNGLLNEEINRLRIENMRLKKKVIVYDTR